jgi:hypothetical protein
VIPASKIPHDPDCGQSILFLDARIREAVQLNMGPPHPAAALLNGHAAGLTPLAGESQALSQPGGFFIVRAFDFASCRPDPFNLGEPTKHAPAD